MIPNPIEELIPQRHPFILVDHLISCNDQLFESTFQIPEQHPLVDKGVLSEGGLLENIAQTAAAGNGYEALTKGIPVVKGFIAGIRDVVVKRLPQANSRLLTRVTMENRVMGFDLIVGEIFEADEMIASCGMKIYCPQQEER